MVFNGWCINCSQHTFPMTWPRCFSYGSVLKNMEMWLFPVLLWFYSKLENNTSDAVGNQHFQLSRRQRRGKRGGMEGERKKEGKALVAALEDDACSALAFKLPQPFSAISKSGGNQTTCFHVPAMLVCCFPFSHGFALFAFPRHCADASLQSVSYKT